MGRHARGASRSRARVLAGALTALVIAAIVVGSWLASRADTGTDTGMVDASAVVVSSTACTAGSGQTLVDVVTPVDSATGSAPGRTALDACGYQEGQQVAVRYRSGDLSTVALAGTTDTTAPGALLPLGLAVAGLLAIVAVLAVYADGRGRPLRHRHAVVGADGRGRSLQDAGDGAGADVAAMDGVVPVAHFDGFPDASAEFAAGRSTVPAIAGNGESAATTGAVDATTPGWGAFRTDPQSMQFPDHNGHGPFTAAQARATAAAGDEGLSSGSDAVMDNQVDEPDSFPWSPDDAARRPEMSSVDLIFPYTSTLAASLHDELFTHRSVSG